MEIKSTSFRTGSAQAAQIHNQIILTHAQRPELNRRELAMVCFVGEGVVQRALGKGD